MHNWSLVTEGVRERTGCRLHQSIGIKREEVLLRRSAKRLPRAGLELIAFTCRGRKRQVAQLIEPDGDRLAGVSEHFRWSRRKGLSAELHGACPNSASFRLQNHFTHQVGITDVIMSASSAVIANNKIKII